MDLTIAEKIEGAKSERVARTVEDLFVWQKAHEFVLLVYKATKKFPKNETLGLTLKFRSTAVAIASNMVEGYKRRIVSEKLRSFGMSQSAAEECRYYIILSKDLKYIDAKTADALKDLIESVGRLLNSYCTSLSSGSSKK